MVRLLFVDQGGNQSDMQLSITRRRLLIGALSATTVILLAVGLQGVSLAQGVGASSDNQAGPTLPVNPDDMMKRASSLLSSTQSFTFHMEKTFDVVLDDGAKVQISGAADVAVRRPDKIFAVYGDDVSIKELWYDGSTFTILDPLHNVFVSMKAASTIDGVLEQLATLGVYPPLAGLYYSDPYSKYVAGVRSKRYIGLRDVEGTPCHHFLFRGDTMDWQVWIENSREPLPCKVVITYKNLEESPQHSTVLTEWNLSAQLDDYLFVARLPVTAGRQSSRPARCPERSTR